MTFTEAANQLKIKAFPTEMDAIWEDLQKTGKLPVTYEMIVHLQEAYDLFADYYEAVLEGFEDLNRDEARRVWVHTTAAYSLTHSRKELKAVELPQTDLTPAGQMAPLFPLICRAEASYFEYLRRGFSEEEARKTLRTYRSSMGVTTRKTGKPGLQRTHYDWSSLYTFTEMFEAGGFKFAIDQAGQTTYVLRNRQTHQLRVLLNGVCLHASGMPLGSAGFGDEEGSYTVSFEETETEYIGYPVVGNLCPNEKCRFSKKEWELGVAPGDDIFCIHIPRGTDLSPQQVAKAIGLARQIAIKNYPERNIKGIRCTSWLLSPKLAELLGENANISRFGALFTRYPFKNNGTGVFSFAFDGKPADYHDLEEKTSLQRKVKALYLAGGCIHNYGGFILDENATV